jgi:Fur family peroxide stress response transcriptional regulator
MKKLMEMEPSDGALQEILEKGGRRNTPQRQHVYKILIGKKDHPTAEEVFIRAKKGMPEISMATVYNCLDALVSCGLVRQVNQDRAATRFCSNMQPHHHFYCDECGGAYDIDREDNNSQPPVAMPRGFRPSRYEVTIRGLCSECASKTEPTQQRINKR